MEKENEKFTIFNLAQKYFRGKFKNDINRKDFLIKNKAFTLVELIIVITILAILGVIAYISFQSYVKDARDGVRLSDIKTIHDGLTIYKTQTEKTIIPDNYIEIQNGNGTIAYQGYVGTGVLKGIKILKGGTDPLTKSYYLYSTDKDIKKIQIMGYLETSNSEIKYLGFLGYKNYFNKLNITEAYGEGTNDYKNRKIYVYGDKIGILTDNNKIPLQELTNTGYNILNNLTGGIITYFGGDVYENGISTQTGITLANQIISAISNTIPCNGETYNGYTINSLINGEIGTFSKPIVGIANGTKTGSLTIECKNGELNHSSEKEIFNLTCNNGFVNNSDNTLCTNDACGGTIPANGESTATSQTVSQNWTYNGTTPGVCSFKCKTNYTYNSGTKTCDADSRLNQLCIGLPTSNAGWNTVNTINQIWNGTDWQPNLTSEYNTTSSITNCRFKCNSGFTYNGLTNSCDGDSCNIPTSESYSGNVYMISGPFTLLHGNTTTKIGTTTFGTNPNDGNMTISVGYSCTAGILTKTSMTEGSGTCGVGRSFNNNWSSPSCTINNYTVSGSFGANASGASLNICGNNVTADSSGNFSTTANYGTNCNNAIATKTGYSCNTTTNGPASLSSNTNNITGSCSINSYTITFNTNGGSSISNQNVNYGLTASIPSIPTKSLYEFSGWYSDSGFTNTYNFSTLITNNITLYAKWDLLTGWRALDQNCGINDITIGTQTWAGCNSTLGYGYDRLQTTSDIGTSNYNGTIGTCYDYSGNNASSCIKGDSNMVYNAKASNWFSGTNINSDTEFNTIWGKLYSRDMMSSNCIGGGFLGSTMTSNCPCPSGRHVPTDTEFATLENYLYGSTCRLNATDRECSGLGWKSHNSRNSSNNVVQALKIPLSGNIYTDGVNSNNRGNQGYLWSSTDKINSIYTYLRYYKWDYDSVRRYSATRSYGFGVRCIKD